MAYASPLGRALIDAELLLVRRGGRVGVSPPGLGGKPGQSLSQKAMSAWRSSSKAYVVTVTPACCTVTRQRAGAERFVRDLRSVEDEVVSNRRAEGVLCGTGLGGRDPP